MGKYMKKKVTRALFRAYEKADNLRNKILLLVVSVTVLLIFGIFSLAIGKVNADIIRNVRYDGRSMSSYLENGTDKEIEQLQKLTYLKAIGQEKIAGSLLDGYEEFCICSVVDMETYKNVITPAITDIVGNYPQKENEIMLSENALNYIGIQEPEIGMEIDLRYAWKTGKLAEGDGIQRFIISGWFQDYTEIKSGKMQAFLSEEFLRVNGVELYPLRVWIDSEVNFLSGSELEKKIYKDVQFFGKNQYLVGADSANYRALENAFGGYGMATCMSFFILLGLFLLIYNILSMSVHKDIKQYGLLEVLGVPQKSIRKMLFHQGIKIWIWGSLIGSAISILSVYTIFPILLKKIYLNDMQSLENVELFHPWLLVFSILFIGVVVIWAVGLSGRQLKRMHPIEALRFEEVDECDADQSKIKTKNILWNLAVKNTHRNKKKFVLTVSSLVLGCVVGLCAASITEGVDQIHRLESNADFQIELSKEICTNELYYLENESVRKNALFLENQIRWLENIAEPGSIEIVKGYLPIYGKEAKEVFAVLNIDKLERVVVVEILSEDKLEEIGNYIIKEGVDIDFENLKDGNGTVVAHQHLLANEENQTKKNRGSYIGLYKAVEVGTKIEEDESVDFVNCGYLDLTGENVPQLNLVWEEREVIHLLVSEKARSRLTEIMPEQVFSVSFDVEKKKESQLKQLIESWTMEQNIDFQTKNQSEKELFIMTANSELIAKEKSYLEGSRMIMGIISISVIFIGLINFLNTFIVGVLSRKRELAVMESIGFTRKQLQKMLVMEGIYYCISVVVGVLTIGSVILIVVEKSISMQVEYFCYNYPLKELLVMIVVLLSICVSVPSVMYCTTKESVVERLRKSML